MNQKRFFYKLLIAFTFLFVISNSFAENFKQYNVYLIPATTADNYVKEFDDSLAETDV